ncbi:GTP:adenosylcobinamide-phosphate guanylyltransferase [Archaeoglobus sulfaticallidus PM70-1]|uniref:GTP:adenosylcobinamide-phosphate guanylyltransferase n=1 Tax=Archaeoglobus sulfaticallidus PM70-1 TaxID=387631 RepID=N0BKA7_9EURY|nr:GTP--adenosylcobinamide-phosphate guanylyltransferase [Archaeoglobus sulfaticallidus]AGK60585.1 GTP:adenosylcobinamide-phosphate guanylyltransferase [Archaeoglobus sulfaticallidus PM70-1]
MVLKVILAGGKSSRMGREKAVLKVGGKRLIERVLDAVLDTSSDCLVALSRNTPETERFCKQNEIPHIRTPGKGYVEDVVWILKEYGAFISISCDIPFIRKDDIKAIERAFSEDISLTGCISLKKIPKGSSCKIYRDRVLIGINTVSEGEEKFFEFENVLLALNINYPFDLYLANLFAKYLDS